MVASTGNVRAEVAYLKRLPLYRKEKPFQLFVPVDPDSADPRTSNLEFENKAQTFVDIRDHVDDYKLDIHGFEIRNFPTALDFQSFHDRDTVEKRYLPEVEQLLKDIEGGYDKVLFFDWRLRNAARPQEEVEFDMNDLTTWLRPSPNVHVDQSARAVLHRIQLHLPDEANFLLRGRVRIINVWRPLEHAVEDYPLAFCDPSSVADNDLVECDHVRRKFKGANLYAHFDPDHKWYYLGEQKPSECVLMKMFDSDPSAKAKKCPHASFHHPSSNENSKPRKSIEVRALIFNYPQQTES